MVVVRGDPTGIPWQDVICDVRVDNHPEPVAELRRLVLRNQALRATSREAPAESVAAAVAAAVAAGLEEPHVDARRAAHRGRRPARSTRPGRTSTACSPSEPRYLELVRRLPDIPALLWIEPVLPGPVVSRPGAGRAGSRGPRSGPARR